MFIGCCCCTLNRMRLFHQRSFHLKSSHPLYFIIWIKQTTSFIFRTMYNAGAWGNENGLSLKQERKMNVEKQNDKMICNLTLDGSQMLCGFYRAFFSSDISCSQQAVWFSCGHSEAFYVRDWMCGSRSTSLSFSYK